MKITTTNEINRTVEIDTDNLKVVMGNARDAESTSLDIYYNDGFIGYGHLNNRTNWAHVTINDGLMDEYSECDLLDYLVDGIEGRAINIEY